MDKDQARVVEILTNVAMKAVLSLATAGVFIAVSVKLLLDPSWPMVGAEGFMSLTVYVVFKHYFPAKG